MSPGVICPDVQLATCVIRERLRLGWSVTRLADAAGLAWQTVEYVEQMNTNAKLVTMNKLARALGCKLVISFERDDEDDD